MKISNLLDKIDEYQLFVPAFQREYVWKREDAKQLVDSLIKNYPTGTMLTWETNKPPELKGKYKYDDARGQSWKAAVWRPQWCQRSARPSFDTPGDAGSHR